MVVTNMDDRKTWEGNQDLGKGGHLVKPIIMLLILGRFTEEDLGFLFRYGETRIIFLPTQLSCTTPKTKVKAPQ